MSASFVVIYISFNPFGTAVLPTVLGLTDDLYPSVLYLLLILCKFILSLFWVHCVLTTELLHFIHF